MFLYATEQCKKTASAFMIMLQLMVQSATVGNIEQILLKA